MLFEQIDKKKLRNRVIDIQKSVDKRFFEGTKCSTKFEDVVTIIYFVPVMSVIKNLCSWRDYLGWFEVSTETVVINTYYRWNYEVCRMYQSTP